MMFNPKIISPDLGSTTRFTLSKVDVYLLVFPVTRASASPQETIQVPQTTLSFLTNLSQSLSSKPSFRCNFL